jgi:uncharacterized protein (TIGR02452 family)
MGMFREERATHAREWVEYISTNFEKEINECIHKTFIVDRTADCDDIQVGDNHLGFIVMSKDSYVYNDDFKTRIAENRTDAHNSKLVLVDTDSVSAIFDFYKPDRKIAVLNFASFTHPGGKFYEGSIAQEEALCHESILYPVLCANARYYDDNRRYFKNNFMYSDRLLYSQDILFIRDRIVTADVITCAAPNMNANSKYSKVKIDADNLYFTLLNRVMLIIRAAIEGNVNTLVLGAWGCGVFMCPPDLVAKAFIEAIKAMPRAKHMNFIFAIPKDRKNYPVFKNVFDYFGGKGI